MKKLFGTDGIRGIANTQLSCELAMKTGRATAAILTEKSHKKPRVLIGQDTRASSNMLENAIAAGLCSVGAQVMTLSVVPTPAVAYLVKKYNCDAAFMISASHNPFEYNGIKIFSSDGYKLPDETEERIEAMLSSEADEKAVAPAAEIGRIEKNDEAIYNYIEHLKKTVDVSLDNMNIALDCANGSASVSAQSLFSDLGASCDMLSNEPNGVNINDKCGSMCLDSLKEHVRKNHLAAGFAFDGDADRVLAVDENGDVVDGDKIVAICSSYMKKENRLRKNTSVVTVMTNMGFYKFCDENEIAYETTSVGDRYVLQRMLEKDCSIGGEQSGHVIFSDYATTGDGQLTALQLLRVMKKTGRPLSELAGVMKAYPQVLINVGVSDKEKAKYNDDKEIKLAIRSAENELSDRGRVLVRASGTEPLVRVMLEGEDETQIKKLANKIAETVKARLNG